MSATVSEQESGSRRRKSQETEEEEEGKTRKKHKVVKRKMPKVRRARDGTLHAPKVVRSIPEANKLRKAIPGMLRDQVKVSSVDWRGLLTWSDRLGLPGV